MSDIKYTEDHESVLVSGDVITVGITDYAKDALGDLVFIELPEAGRKVGKGEEFSVVESVKIASEIYSPVAGEVVDVNSDLDDDVEKLKEDITASGWIVKIKVDNVEDLSSLMSEEEYKSHIEGLD